MRYITNINLRPMTLGRIFFIIKPEDSGSKESPITWRAAENERVILSGGRIISGDWKKDSDGKTGYVDLSQTNGWKRDITQPEVYQKQLKTLLYG